MRRTIGTMLTAVALALVWAPTPAHAEGFFVPWFGGAFSQGPDFRTAEGKPSFGAAVGTIGGGGIFGFDIDFGYTPSFFGKESSTTAENSLFTTTANLLVGPSFESSGGHGARPYGSFGIGLIHDKVGSTSDNKFGWDAAGGVMGYFSSNLGIRGDLRFFHSVNNSDVASTLQLKPGSLHYWRAYVGLIIR